MNHLPWRQEFCVPEGPYVLSHSVGCLLRSAGESFETHFLRPWRALGGDAWPDWLAAIEEFRGALAGLLGGNATQYCPQANLSSGLAKILAALPAPPAHRNVLLTSEHCFPSMAFVLERAAGFSLRVIPENASPGELETWQRALAADDVYAALVNHVHSNTGVVAPVAQIVAECKAREITSIVDVAQSAGILELDLTAWDADIVLGSCVKWLCGGPGAGFLWVRPTLIDRLTPTDVGWFSHEDPFEFDLHHFRFAGDARRFWGGTPSVAPFVLAVPAIRRLAQIGIDSIRAHNLRLQRLLADHIARAWNFSPSEQLGGTSCISLGNALERVERALRELKVRFDIRGDTLRVSFHLYNGENDVRAVAAALEEGDIAWEP